MENKMFRLKRLHSQIRRLFPIVFLVLAIVMMVLWKTQNPTVVAWRFKVSQYMAPVVSVMSAPARWLKAGKDELSHIVFLYKRNNELEEENRQLKSWRALALQLQSEQAEIKKMAGYVSFPKAKSMTARLIMDTGDKFSRSYIALIGREDNLKNGAVALTEKGLFARVIEISDHACRLMLLTDYLSRVPVLVGKKRIPAMLTGDNSNYPKIIFSDRRDEIQPNDIVLTSGYMGVYPAGLNIGLVKSIDEDEITVSLFETGEQLEFVRLVDFGLNDTLLQNECKEP